jgi:5-methyltetrahydrofolate--homocysteine methyltransferase
MSGKIVEQLKGALLTLNKPAMLEKLVPIADGTAGVSVDEAVEAISDALRVAGKRFQEGEWFVTELVYAAEVAKTAMEVLSPLLTAGASSQGLGTVVVGTVAGDLHDLGKNIFVSYAKAAGFDVVDLGVDVSKERFADAALEHGPVAVGLSCLVTVTAPQVGHVIEELCGRGLREKVKVIIGGAALTDAFAGEVGADAFAPDAVTGTDFIKSWSAS